MAFLIESAPDLMNAALVGLGYSGTTLDMMNTYLQDLDYSGFVENMWAEYLSDNDFADSTHDELVAELVAGTLLIEVP